MSSDLPRRLGPGGSSQDPWVGFVASATDDPGSCFYFERGTSPGREGRYASCGFAPSERIVWRHPRDVDALRRSLAHPGATAKGSTWAACVGFDAIGLFEPLLLPSTPRRAPFPLAVFDRYERIVHRRLTGVPSRTSAPGLPPPPRLGAAHDSSSAARFGRSVERLIEAIYEGEAFQVVLSHRRDRHRTGSLLPVVDRLRRRERYAYLYYFRFEDGGREEGFPLEIVGASPESVVEVHGGSVAVNPIAGTRPLPPPVRGPLARLPLDKDPKELAEHRMLVDLARNDIGRVAQVGSVRLARRETRVPYARLEHLVSRVVGRLRPDLGALEALLATFPAGTVSGAPKIRATELLRREERSWRGPYAGAVGLLRGRGEADFALAIRSAFASRDRVYTQAGAGIVHLSEPDREWRETLTKLAMIERALTGEEMSVPQPGGRR